MSRLSVVVYGVVSYLIFLVTFLYLVGFIADISVPKSINDGPALAWPLALLINLGLIGIFALQHTIMARSAFKTTFARVLPDAAERSTYVLASSIALILLFIFWVPMPGIIWSASADGLRALLWGGFLLGWGLVLISTFIIDHFGLFGLRQVWDHWRGTQSPAMPFKTPFLYRWVRHPMMTGFFIALWVMPDMTTSHALLAAGLSFYTVLGTIHEERGLVRAFGDQYREYAARTPRFFPSIKG